MKPANLSGQIMVDHLDHHIAATAALQSVTWLQIGQSRIGGNKQPVQRQSLGISAEAVAIGIPDQAAEL